MSTATNHLEHRSSSRLLSSKNNNEQGNLQSFYLAFAYIKLYRAQPEPEFVYVSDARIPPAVMPNCVRHDLQRLILKNPFTSSGALGTDETAEGMLGGDTSAVLYWQDQHHPSLKTNPATSRKTRLQTTIDTEREMYFKYLGEDVLKKSGLAYTVVRVPDFFTDDTHAEAASSSLRGIELTADNNQPTDDEAMLSTTTTTGAVTHDQVAEVCVSALLDSNALNKSFYIRPKSKQQQQPQQMDRTTSSMDDSIDNSIADQFKALPQDPVSV